MNHRRLFNRAACGLIGAACAGGLASTATADPVINVVAVDGGLVQVIAQSPAAATPASRTPPPGRLVTRPDGSIERVIDILPTSDQGGAALQFQQVSNNGAIELIVPGINPVPLVSRAKTAFIDQTLPDGSHRLLLR